MQSFLTDTKVVFAVIFIRSLTDVIVENFGQPINWSSKDYNDVAALVFFLSCKISITQRRITGPAGGTKGW